MRVSTGRFEKLRFTPCSLCEGAGVGLHHCPEQTWLHLAPSGPFRQCGHLMPFPTHRLPKNHSFSFSPSPTLASKLLRPWLTSRSGSTPSPFQAQGEISPGKNALLHCATAEFTPPTLGHKSFAVSGPLALFGSAFYPVLVHRPAASIHASSPHSVALMQLRFTSLTVTSL